MSSKVKDIIQSACDELQVELWEVVWEQLHGQKVLRILVDTEEGITINQCVQLNKLLCEQIGDDDIKGEYQLEVSSPGVERKLNTYQQVKRYIGQEVYIKLYEKLEGKKELYGSIIGVTEHALGYVVTIDDLSKRLELHSETIATIKIHSKG